MADWNDLKMAFERELEKQEKKFVSDEQTLLEAIAKYLGSSKGTTALMNYDTEEMLDFLQKPISEIKTIIGGEWANIDDTVLTPLIYSLTKKVKKSASILDGTKKVY